MKTPFTLLTKHSDCHPSKRGKEIERFGQSDFQNRLGIFMDILSPESRYGVHVYERDDLATALYRSLANQWQTESGEADWSTTDTLWAEQTGLARRQIDRVRRSLVQDGLLLHERRGFPAESWYRVRGVRRRAKTVSEFSYCPGLSRHIGYKATALFCWLIELDKHFDTQGYFFHLKMTDIQRSLGLSRYQVDQARKKLIAHDLMKERFWGIPAVREFRLRLEGLERLISEGGASQ